MNSNDDRVPAHLRQYLVEQDYSAYDEVAHATWRFVLLHTYERLKETAHPAYANGLHETGMSVERIPRITEMNDRLARFGWGAACVDGFIPPRAFVELQALGILPIAADIRTLAHLAYTPAPDIIHEAAGHAPILVDPDYRAYIQHFGKIGSRAFTLPEDAAVYRAIYTLSEVKEDPSSTREQIDAANAALAQANADCERLSESAALARLYWWTAEYGLVGNTENYKLYGAGLLSSLWESYSCHLPEVSKIPLTAECIDVGYDITRAQPQLFVAKDFAQLSDVLEQVANRLAFREGGLSAVVRAIDSRELATMQLSSGIQISGVLAQSGKRDEAVTWLQFAGRSALYLHSLPLSWRGAPLESMDHRVPLGPFTSATNDWEPQSGTRLEGNVTLRYDSGAQVSGRVLDTLFGADGEVLALILEQVIIRIPDRPPCYEAAPYPLVFGEIVRGYAGAAHPSYHDMVPARDALVPRPRARSDTERELLALYERALESWRAQGREVFASFDSIHRALNQHFPDEWLLRWNLLESLFKLGSQHALPSSGQQLATSLRRELEALEIRYLHKEPIATGLRSLLQHYPAAHPTSGALPLGGAP
ncbi:MAG TPA: aromatic amino acid hydroxylase [Polyangiaceae bacterium]|nr:aromatic amino acid hydroxylase [Polyangiaceae bacterium]